MVFYLDGSHSRKAEGGDSPELQGECWKFPWVQHAAGQIPGGKNPSEVLILEKLPQDAGSPWVAN